MSESPGMPEAGRHSESFWKDSNNDLATPGVTGRKTGTHLHDEIAD